MAGGDTGLGEDWEDPRLSQTRLCPACTCGSGKEVVGGEMPPTRTRPLEEPQWPKHRPAACAMVTSPITSAVEGLLKGGGDK